MNENNESLGIVLAHTAAVHDDAKQALDLGLEAQRRGRDVGVFLISDGVWNAITGSMVSERLSDIISGGGKVFISGEHAEAAGLPGAKVIPGAIKLDKAYESLVDLIMEEWGRVIIC